MPQKAGVLWVHGMLSSDMQWRMNAGFDIGSSIYVTIREVREGKYSATQKNRSRSTFRSTTVLHAWFDAVKVAIRRKDTVAKGRRRPSPAGRASANRSRHQFKKTSWSAQAPSWDRRHFEEGLALRYQTGAHATDRRSLRAKGQRSLCVTPLASARVVLWFFLFINNNNYIICMHAKTTIIL